MQKKDIKEFEEYQITDDGRVWSKKRNKYLKERINHNGYNHICLTKNGKHYYRYVHILVAEAFIPNPENKPCVDHIDTNRRNNVVSNLRWVTHKENQNNPRTLKKMSDSNKGKHYSPDTELKKGCKPLIEKPVNQYSLEGMLINTFESQKKASDFLGINKNGICQCCKGMQETSGGYKWSYA